MEDNGQPFNVYKIQADCIYNLLLVCTVFSKQCSSCIHSYSTQYRLLELRQHHNAALLQAGRGELPAVHRRGEVVLDTQQGEAVLHPLQS